MPARLIDALSAASGGELVASSLLEMQVPGATSTRKITITQIQTILGTAFQPLDSDLTAIAALTTTAYGRSFLPLVDAAAGRTLLGLGTAATANSGDFDAAGAAAAAQAASQPLDSDLTSIASLTTTSYGRGLLTLANQAALIAEVASAYQPLDATLTAFAALTIAANSLTIGSGADAFSQVSFAANTFPARASTGNLVAKSITDFGLSLIADADASAARTTMGLGTAAIQNTGTSGANVPLLNGTNTWSALQTFTSRIVLGGQPDDGASPIQWYDSATKLIKIGSAASGEFVSVVPSGTASRLRLIQTGIADWFFLNNAATGVLQISSALTGLHLGNGYIEQRNGAFAQRKSVYRTYTDASNYERQSHQSGAGYFEWIAETAGTGTDDIDLRLTPAGVGMVDFRNAQDGAGASAGTLTNAPSAGDPAKWLKIKIGGTTYHVPAWT